MQQPKRTKNSTMSAPQLQLITDNTGAQTHTQRTRAGQSQIRAAARHTAASAEKMAAIERVFAHWVFMMEKNAKRCALGPDRVKLIGKALALYDEETLCLAIEGFSTDPWRRKEGNERGQDYTDIKYVLHDEASIERFADEGEALRNRLEQQQGAALRVCEPEPDVDPAYAAEQRRKLRELAASMSGRRA